MAERKVQSKHIPPDYDPRVLMALKKAEPRKKKAKDDEKAKKQSVRIMLPFNVCCATCNSYMYRGRKFNGKKEEGMDPNYLGTKVLRFHIKCETCSAPIVFRTDPKSSGFVMVSGARENKTTAGGFNPLADVVEKDEIPVAEGLSAVAALEARALETKKELEVLNELEREMRRGKTRMAAAAAVKSNRAHYHNLLEERDQEDNAAEDEEEELAAFREKKRMMNFQSSSALASPMIKTSEEAININDDDGGLVVQRATKKKKLTSLVPYEDDDDDDV